MPALTPSEWGQVGLGGVLSALVTAAGTYFVRRSDRPRPQRVDVAQVETVTKGLGDLIDDLQAERKELRHMNRNLRMELDGAYEKAAKAEAALAKAGEILRMAEAVIDALEKLATDSGVQLSPAIAVTIRAVREARAAREALAL